MQQDSDSTRSLSPTPTEHTPLIQNKKNEPSWQEEFRWLLKNSLPIVFTFLLQNSLQMASIFTLGHLVSFIYSHFYNKV